MKHLKLLLVFGLLCKSIDAERNAGKSVQSKENVSFSVVTTLQSYRRGKCCACKCSCPCEDISWQSGVQASIDGCRKAAAAFPEAASPLANTVVTSVGETVKKLIYCRSVNSTIVTSSAEAILKTLSRCENLNGSGSQIIDEFDKVFPLIVKEFSKIATKLSANIGYYFAYCFTNAVSELGCAFSKFMKEFQESCRLFDCKKEADFIPVLKKLQKLMNTLAVIGQALLNECKGKATQEVYDSVLVLYLLYSYLGLSPPGIYSCVLDVLSDRICSISKSVQSCSLAFENALVENIDALSKVVFPFDRSVEDLVKAFVNTTRTLNASMKDILGPDDIVRITVTGTTKNVFKDTKVTGFSTQRLSNILKRVTIK